MERALITRQVVSWGRRHACRTGLVLAFVLLAMNWVCEEAWITDFGSSMFLVDLVSCAEVWN